MFVGKVKHIKSNLQVLIHIFFYLPTFFLILHIIINNYTQLWL